MSTNRSMPSCAVIPVLPYPDVAEAVAWQSRPLEPLYPVILFDTVPTCSP